MAQKRALVGRRDFLEGQVPLLLGRYPDRVAPTHVINGFFAAFYEEGPAAAAVRELLRSDLVIRMPGLSHAITENLSKTRLFRESMNVVLNPDRRVFPTAGSPFPIHASVIASNPADDGFGRSVCELVLTHCEDAPRMLRALMVPGERGDALTKLGFVISNGYVPTEKINVKEITAWRWRGDLATKFSAALAELVMNPIVCDEARLRSSRLVALTRGASCAAFLGSVRSAEFSGQVVKSWASLAPMFVYGGVPPGPPSRPEVRLASRSFESLVASQRRALLAVLADTLGRKRPPAGVPPSQRVEVLLALVFPEARKRVRDEAGRTVKWSDDPRKLAKALMSFLYPAGHLERGFRGMGRMIGLAGPDRGAGAPRFLLETPSMALLVACTVKAGESIPYPDWLDRLYDRYGMLAGLGTRTDVHALLDQLGASINLEKAIGANHEALRKRLIGAGLASEYSDGETEVHGQPSRVKAHA